MRTSVLLAAIAAVLVTIASSGVLEGPPVFDSISGSGGGPGTLDAPYTELQSLAAVSPDDIWAAGVERSSTGNRPRIEHWDGGRWSISPVVPTAGQGGQFSGVAATGPTDVWAVGYSAGIDGLEEGTLIEHWDGRSWSLVPSANPTHTWNELDAVVALSPTDAWAFGYVKDDAFPAEVLVEHWNGTSWDWMPVTSPGKNWNQVAAAKAVGPLDIWAVGWQQDDGPRTALVEHWNGVDWSVIPVPAHKGAGGLAEELRGVAIGGVSVWAMNPTSASSPNDAWLVGSTVTSKGEQTLLEHWDGVSWKPIAQPGGVQAGRLTAVLALSNRDVWIAGTRQDVQPRTLIEHWDGRDWTVVRPEN